MIDTRDIVVKLGLLSCAEVCWQLSERFIGVGKRMVKKWEYKTPLKVLLMQKSVGISCTMPLSKTFLFVACAEYGHEKRKSLVSKTKQREWIV